MNTVETLAQLSIELARAGNLRDQLEDAVGQLKNQVKDLQERLDQVKAKEKQAALDNLRNFEEDSDAEGEGLPETSGEEAEEVEGPSDDSC